VPTEEKSQPPECNTKVNDTVDECDLLEEIPSSSRIVPNDKIDAVPKKQNTLIETTPNIKDEKVVPALTPMIKLVPESRLMPSPEEKVTQPPQKIIKLTLATTPKAIIKPILQSPEGEKKIFEFKKIKIPPNPSHAEMMRIDAKPKTIAPLMIKIKDISTLKVLPSTHAPINISKPSQLNFPQTQTTQAAMPSSVARLLPHIKPPRRESISIPIRSLPSPVPSTSKALEAPARVQQIHIPQNTVQHTKAILLPSHLGAGISQVILPQQPLGDQAVNNREDILRPWIDDPTLKCTKQPRTSIKMLNKYCLAALYKCMGTSCCFFTNDKHLFQIHVELHLKLQTKGFRNCLVCAYCPYLGASIVGLIKHVESEHRFDMYR
jgi:hypothetical protein